MSGRYPDWYRRHRRQLYRLAQIRKAFAWAVVSTMLVYVVYHLYGEFPAGVACCIIGTFWMWPKEHG